MIAPNAGLAALRNGITAAELPVPDQIKDALDRYVEHRIETGSFLRAVLENNLRDAVGHADEQNQLLLCAITAYCWNQLPSTSWDSPARVREWLAGATR